MKYILHDWSDDDCRKILAQLAKSMKKGYSKLIIEELILADSDCDSRHSMWDLALMMFCNSQERSVTHWSSLLGSAGFEVTKFWHPPGNMTGIIEAELK